MSVSSINSETTIQAVASTSSSSRTTTEAAAAAAAGGDETPSRSTPLPAPPPPSTNNVALSNGSSHASGTRGEDNDGGAFDEIDPRMTRRTEDISGRVAKEVVLGYDEESSIRSTTTTAESFDTRELMSDEHNKEAKKKADGQTPMKKHNNNNNNHSSSVLPGTAEGWCGMVGTQEGDREEPQKRLLDAAGDSSQVATFSNNGVAHKEHDEEQQPEQQSANTTRRRLLAEDIVPQQMQPLEGVDLATGPNDKAVQCSQDPAEIQLQDWKEMPRYLQFNPYVLSGYRPLQNVSGCFGSLFYVHNETFNILTHGIPIVYILATVPSKLMWDDYRFLSWCHILGSVAPWCGSFLYHLFMNVNRGERVYYILLKLDMLGIWISQSFGALPMVTATVHCLNWPLKWLFIVMYSLLSIWGLYKAMCATSPWQRRLCFFLPFTMRVLLTMIRFTRYGGGNTTSMTHIFLQDAVSVVGGAIGAMHIPEKWFPGQMDYYLNSHNIMHVLVVLAVYSMHQATVQDLDWMSKAECLMGTAISMQEASMPAAAASNAAEL